MSTGNGAKFSIAFSAAGATGKWVSLAENTASGGTAIADYNVWGSPTSSVVNTATADSTVWIKGLIQIGANSGNITVQGECAIDGTLTVYRGSAFQITPAAR
jgi:hypothetical protein